MPISDLSPTLGGILECHYSHPLLGPVYPLRLAVTTFDPSPIGASHDYPYTGSGAFVPGETGVIATFAAVAACWRLYYSSAWTLTLAMVYLNDAGVTIPLPVVPDAAPVAGVDTATYPAGGVGRRWIGLYSTAGRRWRAWLRQLPAQPIGETALVAARSGGLDARDQSWYDYIALGQSALCGKDGLPFQAGGKVRAWWDTPPAPYVVSG